MTPQGSITGSGGFSVEFTKPAAQETAAPQEPAVPLRAQEYSTGNRGFTVESVQPAASQGAGTAEGGPATSRRSLSELACASIEDQLKDALAAKKENSAQLRRSAQELLKKDVRCGQTPRDDARTAVAARDKAGAHAELYKKEVDSSKISNHDDDFYKTPEEGLWAEAETLYNLAARWIKE